MKKQKKQYNNNNVSSVTEITLGATLILSMMILVIVLQLVYVVCL